MKAITIILLFGILLAGIFVFAWIIVEYGKRDMEHEKEYEDNYKLIDVLIRDLKIDRLNYEKIDLRLSNLRRMPFKNREKTEKLVENFQKKFGKVRIEKHLR
jgi:hypothetical protein